jgi:hypothetical protein
MNESILLIEPRYTKDDAEDILALADEVLRDFLKVESDGVWVSHHHPVGLSWVPYMELEGLDAPNPRTHPALPFPFSASQLAAFMLDGIGAVIREYIGEWVNGPSEGVLERLPDQSRKAAEVLRLAYRAYQVADTSVKSSMADGHCGTGHGSPVWRKQMVLALFKVSTDTGHKARQFAVLGMTEEGGMESALNKS